MKVVLEPLSHPEQGEIVIQDNLFAVGRFEVPFESFQADTAVKLSRRHARIFKENGDYYVADLDSTNGTKLNNRDVQGIPVKLHSGDELNFAGLLYKVRLDNNDTFRTVPEVELPPVELTLEPANKDSGLEPILITEFPFLIGKTNEAFSGYKKTHPEELNYLSRRHALIFQKHDELYIEDLGSTNGTFVSDKRLDEHAKLLCDGDSIAIGGDCFVYGVVLHKQAQGAREHSTQDLSSISDRPKVSRDQSNTTFVTTATSFLNIFCMQHDDEDEDEEKIAVEAKKKREGADTVTDLERAKSQVTLTPRSFWHKAGVFLEKMKNAVTEYKRVNALRFRMTSASLGLGLIVLIVLIVIIGVYLKGDREREIRNLLAEGKFAESAVLSNQLLKEHKDNQAIIELATQALVKSIVPEWTRALTANDFVTAESLITVAEQRSDFNQDGIELLEAMKWMGDLEKFIFDRGGPEAPIRLFSHESKIKYLLEWWLTDVSERRRQLSRILRYEPSFEDLHAQVISHIRKLHSDQSIYVKAIGELNDTIQEKFVSGQVQELKDVFSRFEQRYPKLGGMQQLQKDLEHYLALTQAVQAKNLSQILQLRREIDFQTQPFRTHVAQWLARVLPPESILVQYQQAREDWQLGSADQAIAALRGLNKGPWGDFIAQKLAEYENIAQDFAALKAAQSSRTYGEQVLSFYGSLNLDEDIFYRRAIEAEFRHHREAFLESAKNDLKLVQQYWQSYQQNGGIDGLRRVESSVSDDYRNQAQRLSKAYDHATRCDDIYRLIKISPPENWNKLHSQIEAEIKRQRQWLIDLSMVLNPSLLNAKLELLPKPQENVP